MYSVTLLKGKCRIYNPENLSFHFQIKNQGCKYKLQCVGRARGERSAGENLQLNRMQNKQTFSKLLDLHYS